MTNNKRKKLLIEACRKILSLYENPDPNLDHHTSHTEYHNIASCHLCITCSDLVDRHVCMTCPISLGRPSGCTDYKSYENSTQDLRNIWVCINILNEERGDLSAKLKDLDIYKNKKIFKDRIKFYKIVIPILERIPESKWKLIEGTYLSLVWGKLLEEGVDFEL